MIIRPRCSATWADIIDILGIGVISVWNCNPKHSFRRKNCSNIFQRLMGLGFGQMLKDMFSQNTIRPLPL